MNKLWYIFGIALLLGGLALLGWLSIYVMLYGEIMAAVTNWGVSNSAVVWGIIRAIFFEFGMIPGAFLMLIGKSMLAFGWVSGMSRRTLLRRFGRL